MSETQNESPQPLDEETKTPTKRTPSKRLSNVQRAQREREELIKNMGGSLDVEGGRRTRSSARGGSGPSTPTTNEVKKARTPSTATGRRGRPKKNEASESEENKSHDNESDEASTPKKLKLSDDTESGENCKDNDAASDNEKGATEKDNKTEVDSKLNSIAEEDLESTGCAIYSSDTFWKRQTSTILTMNRFTPEERAEIVTMYIENSRSIVLTQRAYRAKYRGKKAPTDKTIRALGKNFFEHGTVGNLTYNHPRPRRSNEIIEAVRESVAQDPNVSYRHRAQRLKMSETTLRRILKDDL